MFHSKFDRHKINARAKLRNTVVTGIEQMPICPVAGKLIRNVLSIIAKHGIQDAPDILDDNGARPNLMNNPQCSGKQVALVLTAELLAGLGERWARQSSRDNVYARKFGGIKAIEILITNIPIGSIEAQSFASMRIKFY